MVCTQRLPRDFEASNSSKSVSVHLQNCTLNVPHFSEFSEGRDTENPFILVLTYLANCVFQTMEDH